MSLAIGHFAVGGTLTAVAMWLLWPQVKHTRSITLLGGLWAMIPDVGKLEGFGTDAVLSFHSSSAANVFWGHRLLDRVDVGDSPEVSAVALTVFVLVSFLTEARTLQLQQKTASDSLQHEVSADTSERVRRQTPASHSHPVSHSRAVGVTQAVALLALAAGAAMMVFPFIRPVQFAGVLVGMGAVLGLLGVDLLLENAQFATLVVRVVPAPLRVLGVVGLTLAAGSFALVLLSRVPSMTDLSIPYGALSLLLFVLLLRLRTPLKQLLPA